MTSETSAAGATADVSGTKARRFSDDLILVLPNRYFSCAAEATRRLVIGQGHMCGTPLRSIYFLSGLLSTLVAAESKAPTVCVSLCSVTASTAGLKKTQSHHCRIVSQLLLSHMRMLRIVCSALESPCQASFCCGATPAASARREIQFL